MDIKRQKSAKNPSSATHRHLQKSTTLNRKFVKKPLATRIVKSSEKSAEAAARRAAIAAELNRRHLQAIRQKTAGHPISPAQRPTEIERPTPHPTQTSARTRQSAAHTAPRQLTAKELKDRAIARALAQVENIDPNQTTVVQQQMTEVITPKKHFWRRKKLVLALSLSVISLAFLGFLVYRNLPDIISRVTAASSGIEAGEPSHLPKGYRRETITSEKTGKITMTYTDTSTDSTFTLTEEKSSWNSAALLNNYVKPTWAENYSTTTEQGLTIYVNEGNAAWVNGGIFYLIESPTGTLTPTDLRNIAISI